MKLPNLQKPRQLGDVAGGPELVVAKHNQDSKKEPP
jgi:hypothetical protein